MTAKENYNLKVNVVKSKIMGYSFNDIAKMFNSTYYTVRKLWECTSEPFKEKMRYMVFVELKNTYGKSKSYAWYTVKLGLTIQEYKDYNRQYKLSLIEE